MKHIQRILVWVFCGTLLCLLLAGCQATKSAEEPLTVYVDLMADRSSLLAFVERLQNRIVEAGVEDVVFEIEPEDPEELHLFHTRIRTEIMAGKGPDVFLTCCNGYNDLFLMPEKNMALRQFLPLDPYLEQARYLDLDAMEPTVLAAGRNEQGQVLLPITYSVPMAVFLAEDGVTHTPSRDLSWEDMQRDETGVLQAAACAQAYAVPGWPGGDAYPLLEYSFGQLADYAAGTLCFTQEELRQRLDAVLDLEDRHARGELAERLPDFCKVSGLGPFFPHANDADLVDHLTKYEIPEVSHGSSYTVQKEDFTLVPLYSNDGGVPAKIRSFAALNPNTGRPEDAFLVLDLFFEKGLFGRYDLFQFSTSSPIYDNLGTKEQPMMDDMNREYFYSGNALEAFAQVREQITWVGFYDALDAQLSDLALNALRVHRGLQEGDIPQMVEETYRAMRQRLGE